ncbi:putative transcription factor C2H2 family [Helianthus annuus]|nr:putative transcription factor C2H2 family [Helianthus annuus]KAJ0598141.1 putative transcription factor C2H2 family [Helianthus annuus]KAJ0762421.1 putative transcription factor C2H2 family [Helianthus annuus]
MAEKSEQSPPKTEQVCNFFRKPSKNKNIRKRPHNEQEDDSTTEQEEEPSVIINKKKQITPDNKLHFATAPSKRSIVDQQHPDPADTKATIFQFDSSKEIQVQNDSRATATLETETDFSTDARAIRERVLKQADEALKRKGDAGNGEKLYKGIHGYTDYKASGWQMEQEWDEAEKARKRKLAMKGDDDDDEDDDQEDDDDEDGLPFACFICRQPFVDPVVTKCKHYFCEHCALKHHAKKKKCYVCNQPTLGIFNTAHEIRKRIAAEGK